MNSRERMLCALAGGTPDQVPFGETDVDPVVARQLAGTGRNPSELEITEMLGRDVLPFDAFPPIFAVEERSSDGQVFYTRGSIESEADLARVVWPNPLAPEFCAAAHERLGQRGPYAAVARIRLGISAAYISMGFETFSLALFDNLALVKEVLRRFAEWTARRIDFLQEIGYDLFWAFDDIAYNSGLLFSPQTVREVLLPGVWPAIERIRLPWVFHSDGDLTDILDDLVALGISGLHPLEPGAMDIGAVRRRFGPRLCLLGNVSVDTLARGTPADVDREVLGLMREVAPTGGFVLTSSNSVPHYALPQNVTAMAQAVKRYGKYPIAV